MAIMNKMESGLPSVIPTGDIGQFALYAGSVAMVLVCLLAIQVVVIRVRLMLSQKRRANIQAVWRQVIGSILVGEEPVYPKIKRRDIFYILEEYNYVFGVIRGIELNKLRKVYHDLKVPVSLKALLKSGSMRRQLFALITLGNIRDGSSWELIKDRLSVKQPVVSLSAARALVLIEPHKAANEIIPVLLQRKDWPWANIAHILKLAGPGVVCQKLSELVLDASLDKQSSLLRLYGMLQCDGKLPISRQVLQNAEEDKIASVCLNISQDPKIISQARDYAHHARWHVRMNAAVAIGRFGQEEDIPLLIHLVKDREWWVRYRAAQALLSMPFVDNERIQRIRAELKDPYADDILVQVMNEGEYD